MPRSLNRPDMFRPSLKTAIKYALCVAISLSLVPYILLHSSISKLFSMSTIFTAPASRSYWYQSFDASQPCNNSSSNLKPAFSEYFGSQGSCNVLELLEFDSSLDLVKPATSANSTKCPRIPIGFRSDVPGTRLVAWPSSGDKWMVRLIQELTGLHYFADFYERSKDIGFLGDGRTGWIKGARSYYTGDASDSTSYKLNKQILLLRNPFEAVAEEYQRQIDIRDPGSVRIVTDKQWDEHVSNNTRKWADFVRATLTTFPGKQIIVLYEDLVSCLPRELINLARFYKTDAMKQFSICCAFTMGQKFRPRRFERAVLQTAYQGKLATEINAILSELADFHSLRFPILAQRLRQYQLL